jgi:branched-chain amino acid transport system ATP-binding protein
LLSGMLRPDSGQISLLGHDVTTATPESRVKQGLARSFQVNNLFRDFTILENVYLAVCERMHASLDLWHAAGERAELLDRAEQTIETLGLTDDLHRKIGEVSYGRQRLVELAIALSLAPKVLLLDEPAAGVPVAEVDRLLDTIDQLPSDIAILLIEHDMQVVRRFAKEVTVLVAGQILMSGLPEYVMGSERVHALYLGRSAHERFTSR